MVPVWKALAMAALVAAILTACGADSPDPSPTPTPATQPPATSTAAPSPTATAATTPTSASTPTPVPTPSPTSSPATPTPTPEPTPTPSPTPTPTATATPPPEPTPTPSPTPEEPIEHTPASATRPALPQSPTYDAPPGVYTAITVGYLYACALSEDGEAVCWDIESATVWDIPPGPYTFIDAEGEEVCAITAEGQIVCRSRDWAQWSPDDVPAGRYSAIAMSAGYYCALTVEGKAVCWLTNQERPTPAEPPAGVFTAIGVGSSVDYFPSGGWETRRRVACATSETGQAVCWEAVWNEVEPTEESQYVWQSPGNYRPVGTWASADCRLKADGEAPCMADGVDDPLRYQSLAEGGGHMCAITEGGKAICRSTASLWMAWMAGEPGGERVMTPPDPAPERFVAVGVGGAVGYPPEEVTAYACALTETGRAVCWSNVPNKLERSDPDPNRYVAVSEGLNHTCALTESAEAVCWGWNDYGQAEAPPGRYVSISAGVDGSCALAQTGEVACWGRSVSTIFEPGSYQAVAIATGAGVWDGACVVTESGTVMCRQQGDGLYGDEVEYVESQEGPFATLGVGGICGLTEEGAIVCWSGWRSYREGESLARRLPGTFVALSDGPGHACAISEAAEVVCWWHLGDRWSPGLPDGSYMAVSAGYERGCALTDDGEARCWELGQGLVDPPPGRYVAISSGWYRTCAVTEAGEVVCWGNTSYQRSKVPSK